MNVKPILYGVFHWTTSILGGAFFNSVLLQIGLFVVPPPAGVSFESTASLAKAMPVLSPIHFLAPFIAHTGGSFMGGFVISRLRNSSLMRNALIVGGIFFAAGAYMVYLLPSPLWFNITDLMLAYFPAAYLGFKASRYISRAYKFEIKS